VHLAVDRAKETQKKARVVLTVEIDPRDDVGSLIMRANVEAKLPKLPPAATQMHVGPNGELLTQMEFLMDGGKSEAPKPIPNAPSSSASGRMSVAAAPSLAPLAPAVAVAPLSSASTTVEKNA
jgi:hypothetical protein